MHIPSDSGSAGRWLAAWLDRHALWALLPLAPLWLFPSGWLPWVGLALALALQAAHRIAHPGERIKRADIPLVFLILMGLVAVTVSADRGLSAPRAWSLAYGLLVYFELRRLDLFRINPALPAGALLLAAWGLGLFSLLGTDWSLVRLFPLPELYDRLPILVPGLPGSGVPRASELINPRWTGITLGLLAPACLPLAAWRGRRALRSAALAGFLFLTAVMLLTQSVQGVLAWMAGLWLALWFTWRRPALAYSAVLIAGALALVGLWSGPLGDAMLSVNDPMGIAVLIRVDIWSRGLAMLGDMPFTGIGLNTFPVIQGQFYPGYLIGNEPHAHNLYLQTALDFGLPGLAAFLWFAAGWFLRTLRAIGREPDYSRRLLLAGCAAGVLGYLAHGLIDGMMLGAKPGFAVWGLLGVGAALARPHEDRTARRPPAWFVWAALPLLAGLLALASPGRVWLNLGAVGAQRALVPFPVGSPGTREALAGAQVALARAAALHPDARQAHFLLGRIAAYLGDYVAAVGHYRQVVALDLEAPFERYFPPEVWLRDRGTQPPGPPVQDLAGIYSRWVHRYPDRAENFLLLFWLAQDHRGDAAQAARWLEQGLAAGAVPQGLLEAALGSLVGGE